MTTRLREFAGRPVRDLPTGLVLAVCVLIILAGALLLARIGDPAAQPAPQISTDPEAGYEVTNPDAPSWDLGADEHPDLTEPAPDPSSDRVQVRDAAQDFLVGYLRYTDERGAAADITDATRQLIAWLEQSPPRQSPGAGARRSRVVAVRLGEVGTDRAVAAAMVDDGVTRYLDRLELVRTPSDGWRVNAVGPG